MLDAWTLKKLVRRVKEFTRATTMEANGGERIQNSDFWTWQGATKFNIDQSGTVRNFRKG